MSPYGGVAAIVLLPHEITVTPDIGDPGAISPYPDLLGLPNGGWQPVGVAPPARLAADAMHVDPVDADQVRVEATQVDASDNTAEDTLGLPKRVRGSSNAAADESAMPSATSASTPDEIGALV